MDTLNYYVSLIDKLRYPQNLFEPPSIHSTNNEYLKLASNTKSTFLISITASLNPFKQDYYNGIQQTTAVDDNSDFYATKELVSDFLGKQDGSFSGTPVGSKNSTYIKEQINVYNNCSCFQTGLNTSIPIGSSKYEIDEYSYTETTRTIERSSDGTVESDVTVIETGTSSDLPYSSYFIQMSDGVAIVEQTITVQFTAKLYSIITETIDMLENVRIFTYLRSRFTDSSTTASDIYDYSKIDLSFTDINESSNEVTIPLPEKPTGTEDGSYDESNRDYRTMFKTYNFTLNELKAKFPKPTSWN